MKPRTIIKLALLAALLLVVALVQVVKSIDVDQYRGLAAQWMLHQTGRTVAFEGPLTLKLSLRPALCVDGVSLSDRPGAAAPLLRLGHVEAEIGLLPLLSGEVKIGRLWLDGVDVNLETDAQGRGNWEFAEPAGQRAPEVEFPTTTVRLTEIVLDHVKLHVTGGADHRLTIDHATLDSDGPAAPMALTLDGQWDNRHLSVSGVLGSLKDLLASGKPFPLNLKALLPGFVVSLNGNLRGDPQQGLMTAMAATIDIADSADLDGWFGVPLPSLGSARAAMTLTGRLAHPHIATIEATVGRHDALAITVKGAIDDPLAGSGVDLALTVDGDAATLIGGPSAAAPVPLALGGHVSSSGMGSERGWRIADLKGSLGRSDLSGQLSLRQVKGRDLIEGQFESALIDLGRQREPAAEPAKGPVGDGRAFSDGPLPLQYFANGDGHLIWHIGRLEERKLSAAGIGLDLAWRDGGVVAAADIANLAGGSLSGRFSVDPARQVAIDLTLSHLGLGDLLNSLALTDAVGGGKIDFRLKATSSGDNPRAIIAGLQGSSLLSMASVRLANKLAQDGLGQVMAYLTPNPPEEGSDLRCLVSHFTMADGLARSEALLFAMGNAQVSGQGSLNLVNESLDFTLTPRPAGQNAATPLDIGGSILHPLVTQNRGAIVKNLPALAIGGESPLLTLAAAEPCAGTLTLARKARGTGR